MNIKKIIDNLDVIGMTAYFYIVLSEDNKKVFLCYGVPKKMTYNYQLQMKFARKHKIAEVILSKEYKKEITVLNFICHCLNSYNKLNNNFLKLKKTYKISKKFSNKERYAENCFSDIENILKIKNYRITCMDDIPNLIPNL